MKYLKEIQSMKVFTLADVAKLTKNVSTAASLISYYKKTGLIASVRKNLYVALDIVTSNPIASKYEIASQVSKTSFVSHHSALEYYGVANQVFFEVNISAKEKISHFIYDGLRYRPVKTDFSECVVTPPDNPLVNVTSIERTVVDCIHNIKLAGGFEELLECINLIPALNESELIKCLNMYDQKKLWQYAGFILEQYNRQFRLSESFFDECKKKIGIKKNYLNYGNSPLAYYSEWRLYAPEDLSDITGGGEDIIV